ncbi:MAG: HlyD family efflux transporter periplasmic adaptor subunit [Spirochaetota bacterium]
MKTLPRIAMFSLASLLLSVLVSCGQKEAYFDASGSFEATEVIVSAEAAGRILRFDADEGKQLKAGEIIGAIDNTQLRLKRELLLAARETAGNRRPDIAVQMAAQRQQLATARSEQLRMESLVQENAAVHKQLDDANAQVAVLERQLAAMESSLRTSDRGIDYELASLDIQIAQIDDQLAKCLIASPIDGTVLLKYAERGELAGAGKALFKVADMQDLRLRAYVTEAQLSTLRLGQTVSVFVDSGADGHRRYDGLLSWISDKAEFTPKTAQTRDERAALVYAVKVSVRNDGYLKIGMYGYLVLGE